MFPRGKMLIHETTINCCKPNRCILFKGQNSQNSTRKVRYKHYEQISDEVLCAKSILKAHNDVQSSKKMRLFKALPTITTAVAGVSIALTQPGKLAAKVGAGLGFLAVSNLISLGFDKLGEKINKNPDENKNGSKFKKIAKPILAVSTCALGVAAVVVGKKTNKLDGVKKFFSKEVKQLTDEINNTKLAKKLEEKIIPFETKNKKAFATLGLLAPLGVIASSLGVQIGLAQSLSSDIKEKAVANFAKGKAIQAQARAHFDSIDAQEV